MTINKKLNFSILILLLGTFISLTVVTNVEIKTKGSVLVETLLQKIKQDNTVELNSLTGTFDDIEKTLDHANQTTRDIVTDLYLSSYGILAKSVASQIFPLVVEFELESVEKIFQDILRRNPSIPWLCYAISESPTELEKYEQGTKISGLQQKIFRHVIKDDFNYLEVQVQVNLESMEAVSKIEMSFAKINRENKKLIEEIKLNRNRSMLQINAFSISASRKNQNALNIKLTIMMIAAFLLVSTALFLISRSIIMPILKTVSFAERISKGDFTQTIKNNRKDEIGSLIGSLSGIVFNLGNVFKELKKDAGRLSDSSSNLSSVSDRLSMVSQKSNSQAEAVSNAAQSIRHGMSDLVLSTRQAGSSIDTILSSADGMNLTIAEVAKTSEITRDAMAHVVKRAHKVHEKTTGLEKNALDISAIASTITEISERTNLLALNATIEAARAGSSGKGFAVVAGEIKELSKQTAAATLEIKKHIQGIQNSSHEVVYEISEITKLINNADEMAVCMAESMEVQSVKTNEIAENVYQVSVGIKEITASFSNSQSSIEEISTEIDSLSQTSGTLSKDSRNVNKKSAELNAIASKLFEIVGEFRL